MKEYHYCIKPPGKRKSEGYVEARSERAAKKKIRARRKVKRLQGLVFFRRVWVFGYIDFQALPRLYGCY